MRSIKGEGVRFLIAGGVNTLLTYIIYLLLLNVAGYVFAFSISFLIGIVVAFFMYSLFVFRTSLEWRKLMQYPALYAVQYGAGLVFLSILVEYFGLDERVAPVVNVAILTPITFILNRWFLAKRWCDDAEKCR